MALEFECDASQVECRELVIGPSVTHRLMVVGIHRASKRIRPISARRATPQERRDYEQGQTAPRVKPIVGQKDGTGIRTRNGPHMKQCRGGGRGNLN